MFALARLHRLVDLRLGGDRTRLLELFDTREVFDLLRAASSPSDWFHFEPRTFDGQYLVEEADGFVTYLQDRGVRSNERRFASLREAASTVFR